MPRSGTARSCGNTIFSFFKGTSICFFILAAPIYIFTTSVISKRSLAIISLFKSLRNWLVYTRIVTTPSRNFPNQFKYKDMKRCFSYFTSAILGDVDYYSEDNKTQMVFCGSNINHLLKAGAAVTSQVLLIKVAPHWCMLMLKRSLPRPGSLARRSLQTLFCCLLMEQPRFPQPERDAIVKL